MLTFMQKMAIGFAILGIPFIIVVLIFFVIRKNRKQKGQ